MEPDYAEEAYNRQFIEDEDENAAEWAWEQAQS